MISYIRGELITIEQDKVILETGGIGYGIFMPEKSMGYLPPIGSEVRLHTYLNVKEDAMQLYGFLTKDELAIFKLLISVNGIGPKGGLGILSELRPDDLRFAVMAKDVKAISKAPGIGKKTAEKLILELKDKLKIEDVLEHQSEQTEDVEAVSIRSEAVSESVEALVALGYGSTEALRAVKKVDMEQYTTVETILKQALKHLI